VIIIAGGSAHPPCNEEGWRVQALCGLPRGQSGDSEELVSPSMNLRDA